jgi:hypothetical protein
MLGRLALPSTPCRAVRSRNRRPATPGDVECAIFDDGEFLQDSGNKVKLKMVLGLT